MSCPKLQLILSPQAQNDLMQVLQYTLSTWGKAQADVYRSVLYEALALIQENPKIGHEHPKLSPHHKVFPAGRHIIVYRVSKTAICVSRILHERMDIGRHV